MISLIKIHSKVKNAGSKYCSVDEPPAYCASGSLRHKGHHHGDTTLYSCFNPRGIACRAFSCHFWSLKSFIISSLETSCYINCTPIKTKGTTELVMYSDREIFW